MDDSSSLLDRLMGLWTEPLPSDDTRAQEAFRALYTDPVPVNGVELSAGDLVARARALQAALADVHREILDSVTTEGKVAFAFRLTGRHVGPFVTPLGTVPATGRTISMRAIDVLTVTDGLISNIWMVGDDLGTLAQLDAVRIVA